MKDTLKLIKEEKEGSIDSLKNVIDYLGAFPVIGTAEDYLANFNARNEGMIVLDPNCALAKMFKGRIPNITELFPSQNKVPFNNIDPYSLLKKQETKKAQIVSLSDYKREKQQENNSFHESRFSQPKIEQIIEKEIQKPIISQISYMQNNYSNNIVNNFNSPISIQYTMRNPRALESNLKQYYVPRRCYR